MHALNGSRGYFIKGLSYYLGCGALILWISAVIAGCATVNADPFVKFSNAVKEAQNGIDAATSTAYNWTKSGFIEGFSSSPSSKFSELIVLPGANYEWSMPNAPIYLDIKQTRSALFALNGAFSEYATLLAQLAGGELVSSDTFDQLTKDLNKNANDALKSLKVAAPTEGIAIFSTAAVEVARQFIEKKRRSYLKETITENQKNVQAYSDLCISLIHTLRGNIKAYYVDRYRPIKDAWNSSKGEMRQKQTEAMLNLNEQFVDSLRVLQELETAYVNIPKAHAELSKAVDNKQFSPAEIQQLYSSGRRLQRLYNELRKAGEK